MDLFWLLLRLFCFTATRSLRSGARRRPLALRCENSASRLTESAPARGIQPTLRRYPTTLEMTSKRHSKRIEDATKAHSTSATIADHQGRLMTIDDNDDRATGATAVQPWQQGDARGPPPESANAPLRFGDRKQGVNIPLGPAIIANSPALLTMRAASARQGWAGSFSFASERNPRSWSTAICSP